MGLLFRYIADEVAGAAEKGECPLCQGHAPLFPIDAVLDHSEWTVSADRVDALCSDCIRRLPLRLLEPRKGERFVQGMINDHFPKGTLTGDQRIHKIVSFCDE